MTNSYSLFQRPKIVFFHGLNNNQECFTPLMDHFRAQGHETEMIILPGHGTNRDEARDIQTALSAFKESMERLKNTTYYAIAFSQGALYLQLWMEQHQEHRPLKQVLLSPALAIRRQLIIEKALKLIPGFVLIKSLAPRRFRRYDMLTAREYNTLLQGILAFQKLEKSFKIPTLLLIDPADELVHAQKLQESFIDVGLIKRNYLKFGPGQHHILFHPDYFKKEDWKEFTRKIETFLGL